MNQAEIEKRKPQISKYLPKPHLGIFRRLLTSFLLISIIPILIFGYYTTFTLDNIDKKLTGKIKTAINEKTLESLELQAIYIAKSVRKFLKQCEYDLLSLTSISPTANNYLKFSKNHLSEIWHLAYSNSTLAEIHEAIPLYKEISFIDKSGRELISVKNGKLVPAYKLKNVANPKNTTYKCENYFTEAKKLKPGEIYVGHVTGFYISKNEQLNGAKDLSESPPGKFYDGVIRFATPVYTGGKLRGVVMIALDHRHLMEFTQHVLPLKKEETVFPDYNSGDYAFMFDDEGWIITHPKLWDIRGVDKNGNWVKAYTSDTPDSLIKAGKIPFNLFDADFIHPNYPFVAEEIIRKHSGTAITTNVGGIKKVMAYAPIIYDTGEYKNSGIFGGITIGTQLEKFQSGIQAVADELNVVTDLFRRNIFWFTLFTFLAASITSFFVSRSFTKPIIELTKTSQRLAEGNLHERIYLERDDEIGALANSFNFMAYELEKSKSELIESLEYLELSKSKIESYAKDLEYQLKIFRSIQRISNILGKTFEMNTILKIILKNCVQSIGFDRAILYLKDDSGKYLECKEIWGFSPEDAERVIKSKYNIEHCDCIETKVARSGKIIYVEDFKNYKEATEVDRKIRDIGKSNSFIFVPLKAKEEIIGIMGADKSLSEGKITELDINSLQILANQASRVIENTKLYQELIRQRNFVENILKFMPNAVLTIDDKGKILSANETVKNIFEIDHSKIIGEKVEKAFEKFHPFVDEIKRFLHDGSSGLFFAIKQKINDEEKILEITTSDIYSDSGKSSGFILIIADITEKTQREEHMQEMERLVLLGKFAAGIAHEIRNPLTGISLFMDDLHDKVVHDKEISKVIELALSEVERLENLVNELLEYANPSRGNYALTDIHETINSTLMLVRHQFEKMNIETETEYDESLEKFVFDKEKIKQAFLNLFINAMQAMKNGGKLKISTTRLKKNIFLHHATATVNFNEVVKITISDTGPGIDPESISKVFEPFYTTKKGGTGLGLSITQTIISEHQGKILVFNKLEGGASFVIYLPYITEENYEKIEPNRV